MGIEAARGGLASAWAGAVRRPRSIPAESGRETILAACRTLLGEPIAGTARDGYPTLGGTWQGRPVRLALVPDTLAPRRLPQLWLALTASLRFGDDPIVFTARPRGDDYLSGGGDGLRHQPVPAWLPPDFAIRTATSESALVERLREPLATFFADPLAKEIALQPGRLRLLYRVAEGRRGAHLLLRQARFDAVVAPALLKRLLQGIDDLEAALALRDAVP